MKNLLETFELIESSSSGMVKKINSSLVVRCDTVESDGGMDVRIKRVLQKLTGKKISEDAMMGTGGHSYAILDPSTKQIVEYVRTETDAEPVAYAYDPNDWTNVKGDPTTAAGKRIAKYLTRLAEMQQEDNYSPKRYSSLLDKMTAKFG